MHKPLNITRSRAGQHFESRVEGKAQSIDGPAVRINAAGGSKHSLLRINPKPREGPHIRSGSHPWQERPDGIQALLHQTYRHIRVGPVGAGTYKTRFHGSVQLCLQGFKCKMGQHKGM